jgi:hypothetical protein
MPNKNNTQMQQGGTAATKNYSPAKTTWPPPRCSAPKHPDKAAGSAWWLVTVKLSQNNSRACIAVVQALQTYCPVADQIPLRQEATAKTGLCAGMDVPYFNLPLVRHRTERHALPQVSRWPLVVCSELRGVHVDSRNNIDGTTERA